MLLVKCPKCGNSMKCNPLGNEKDIAGKKKRCVYCGYTIPVAKHIIKRLKA